MHKLSTEKITVYQCKKSMQCSFTNQVSLHGFAQFAWSSARYESCPVNLRKSGFAQASLDLIKGEFTTSICMLFQVFKY